MIRNSFFIIICLNLLLATPVKAENNKKKEDQFILRWVIDVFSDYMITENSSEALAEGVVGVSSGVGGLLLAYESFETQGLSPHTRRLMRYGGSGLFFTGSALVLGAAGNAFCASCSAAETAPRKWDLREVQRHPSYPKIESLVGRDRALEFLLDLESNWSLEHLLKKYVPSWIRTKFLAQLGATKASIERSLPKGTLTSIEKDKKIIIDIILAKIAEKNVLAENVGVVERQEMKNWTETQKTALINQIKKEIIGTQLTPHAVIHEHFSTH